MDELRIVTAEFTATAAPADWRECCKGIRQCPSRASVRLKPNMRVLMLYPCQGDWEENESQLCLVDGEYRCITCADAAYLRVDPEDSEVRKAMWSDDLPTRLAALDKRCSPITRHFLLLQIVEMGFRGRKTDPEMRSTCIRVGRLHMSEYSRLDQALCDSNGGDRPRVSTFEMLAKALGEIGDYDGAIEACKEGLRYDMGDGTKGGFEGRIKRLEKARDAGRA